MKKITLITLVSLLVWAVAPLAGAQTETSTAAEPAAEPAATGDPNMADLFTKVSTAAKDLESSLADLETKIQESRDSIEKGGEALDAMLASVTAVNGSMAEDSAIWTELGALLDLWEERRKTALQKSESNPAFQDVAEEWKGRISAGKQLRQQISTERANSLALMRSIESDREIILAYYELGQADKALASLEKVGANLVQLNENMQTIVETAGSVEQPISN